MFKINPLKTQGQVTLELATAFICIFLLLIASVKLCTWFLGQMVVRQENYESSRARATSTNIGEPLNEPTQNFEFFK